jgi:signal peptide peptidase SppA
MGLLASLFRRNRVTVPVVRLSGAIGMNVPLRTGLTVAAVAGSLERAFRIKSAPAVALVVNSPGGSPVQSHLIYRRIRTLAERHDKRVLVFVEDVAASGGYLIALAGDEIIVDAASIVGSIGVVSAGFGFDRLIERIGVERRVHTAGDRKMMLDPFRPENPDDVAHLKALQGDVHEDFINLVRSRRGPALRDDPDLFSGAFWSGNRGVALGLADRVGEINDLLRERYGDNVALKVISSERRFWRRRLGIPGVRQADSVGLAVGQTVAVLAERALWSRFGL